MESSYRIRLTGELQQGVSRDQAIANFAQLFNLPPETAQATLDRAPLLIKSGIDAQTAEKYCAALTQVGLVSVSEREQTLTDTTAVVAPETPVADATATQSSPVTEPAPDITASSTPAAAEPEQPGMAFRIAGQPDFSFLTVQLAAGETIKVEAAAMATMDTNIRMKTRLRGGLGRFLTGESLFLNEFTAEGGPGEIGIAPAAPGDLDHVHLKGDTLYLQNSAFVAASPEVQLETKWQGLMKGFFSGENLFLIRASGTGDLWFNTYGALIRIDVDGEYVVDTGNIVAFTHGLDYDIRSVGGYKSLFLSGEGLVCRFRGQGRLWIQTRGVQAFAHWAQPFRRVEKKG